MMVHGLSSLARMEDDHLDAMDPYQRDAHGISKYHAIASKLLT